MKPKHHQHELWQQCRDWLIAVGVLEQNLECNQLQEFAAVLKDGVRLCKLVNILKEGCIERSSIYFTVSDSPFSREKNIYRFLNACQAEFSLNESDFFTCSDLEEFKQFEKVLKTISALSRTEQAISKGFQPILEASFSSEPSNSSENIYCNLQPKADHIYEKYETAHHQNEESKKEQIYYTVIMKLKTVEDIKKFFKPHDTKEGAINELLQTETTYLNRCLKILMTNFYTPLKQIMTADHFQTIFANIDEIYKIHQSFHNDLQEPIRIALKLESRLSTETNISIGDVFLKNKTAFLAYAKYCANLKSAIDYLIGLKESSEIKSKISELEKKVEQLIESQSVHLEDLLAVPFQRICKYELLLKEMVKNTNDKDPEKLVLQRALDSSVDVVKYVDQFKGDTDMMNTIVKREKDIVGIERLYPSEYRHDKQSYFEMYGRLQVEDYVKLIDSNISTKEEECYIFVFEQIILICNKENSVYEFKSAYKMADYFLQGSALNIGDTVAKPQSKGMISKILSPFITPSLTLMKGDRSKGTEHRLQIFFKSSQQKDLWEKKIEYVITRNHPNTDQTDHELSYRTFTDYTNCNVCDKLLLGRIYQGYHCAKCNENFHFDCRLKSSCKRSSFQSIISYPGSISKRSARYNRYVAIQCVSSPDPNFLSFDEGEEIIVYKECDAGTLFGRRVSLPGKSGRISKDTVRQSFGQSLDNQRISNTSSEMDMASNENIRPFSPCYQNTIVNMPTLESEPWYFGSKSKEEANNLLAGKPDGTFLVRFSLRQKQYALSIRYNSKCRHVTIVKSEKFSRKIEYYIHPNQLFNSIVELVKYYKNHSLVELCPNINTSLVNCLIIP